MGEPFRPVVEIQGMERVYGAEPEADAPKQALNLAFRLMGAADERVTDIARTEGHATKCAMSVQNPNRPKQPSYRIVKADGTEVVAGRFKYG